MGLDQQAFYGRLVLQRQAAKEGFTVEQQKKPLTTVPFEEGEMVKEEFDDDADLFLVGE